MLDHTKGAPPLYSQVKSILKKNIAEELYPVHENIPTEKELQEAFGVSRITVRKALDELLNEGYIERQRGKGTVVLPQGIIEENLHSDKSFTEDMKSRGLIPGTKVSRLREVRASGAIAEGLDLEQGVVVLELTRVRTADEIPVVIFKSYINPNMIEISLEEIESNESLYSLIKQKGHTIKLIKEIFEVTLSTEWNSHLLETPLGTPLLKRSSIIQSEGKRMIYTESLYNGYLYRYSIDRT